MNKKRVALALAAALGINTLMVTVAPSFGGQTTIAHAQTQQQNVAQPKADFLDFTVADAGNNGVTITLKDGELASGDRIVKTSVNFQHLSGVTGTPSVSSTVNTNNTITVSNATVSGIYTVDVEIQRAGKTTTETYKLSFRKIVADQGFDAKFAVTHNAVEVSDAVFNGQAIPTNSPLVLYVNGKKMERTYNTTAKFGIPAGLKEGDKLELGYTPTGGTEQKISFKLIAQKEAKVTHVDFTTIDTELKGLGGTIEYVSGNTKNATQTGLYTTVTGDAAGKDINVNIQYTDKNGTVDVLGTNGYTQTLGTDGNNHFAWGGDITATVIGDVLDLTIKGGTAKANTKFVPYIQVNKTISSTGTTNDVDTLAGEFIVSVEGTEKVYFDTKVNSSLFAQKVVTATNTKTYVEFTGTPVKATQLEGPASFVLPVMEHGYATVDVKTKNKSDVVDKINTLNGSITTDADKAKLADDHAAKTFTKPVAFTVDKLDAISAQVNLVNVVETKDGKYNVTGTIKVNAPADFVVSGTGVSGFTFGGVTATDISTDVNGNITFKVDNVTPANGKFTYSFDLTEGQPKANTTARKVRFDGGVEAVGTLQAFTVTSGNEFKLANNSQTDFTYSPKVSIIDGQNYKLGIIKPDNKEITDLDGIQDKSITVKATDFTNGGVYTLVAEVKDGKYAGKYYAGMKVDVPTFSVEVKATSATSNTITLEVTGKDLITDALKQVDKAFVQYRLKGTTEWKNGVEIPTADAQTKDKKITVAQGSLESAKEYELRVVYQVIDEANSNKLVEEVIATATAKTNTSSSSTITGSGSSSSTTGTSTGSTTISVNTNNSTLSGTSASVKLPSGFRYDSSKTPVAISFKYKDKDGKVVTETKEQFSNVTAKFNGDNVEVNGLVPGKNYDEITVDYTDNNGRTRSIILRNIQTSTTVESDKYLANVYTVVFNRPADEAGYHFHLDNLKNKRVSLREFLLNMLSEKEFIEKYKSTEQKVEALYSAIVARSSDEAGKKFWVEEYNKALKVYGSESTALRAIADRMVNENELKELADKMGVQW